MDGPRLLIGVLHDYPDADGGAAFEWAVRHAFAEVEATGRLPGPVELVHETAFGLPLPGGTARSVEDAFHRLDEAGVLAVLGPAISDNAIVTRPLSDRSGSPRSTTRAARRPGASTRSTSRSDRSRTSRRSSRRTCWNAASAASR